MTAANDEIFNADAVVSAYAEALEKRVTDTATVNAEVTKHLKAKLGFFGDGSKWSQSKIARFDELLGLSLLLVAQSHLRHELTSENVENQMLIKHINGAVDTLATTFPPDSIGNTL